MSLKEIIKSKNAKAAEISQKLTDSEQLVKKISALEETNKKLAKERDQLKQAYDSFKSEIQTKEVRSKIASVASSKRAVDPDDIVSRFADKAYFDAEKNEVRIRDSERSLDEEVSEFLKNKPYLQVAEKASGTGANPFPKAPEGKEVDIRSDAGATEYVRSLTPAPLRRTR